MGRYVMRRYVTWWYVTWNISYDVTWHDTAWDETKSHNMMGHDVIPYHMTYSNMTCQITLLKYTIHMIWNGIKWQHGTTWCILSVVTWSHKGTNHTISEYSVVRGVGVGQMFAAVHLTVLSADRCSVNDVLVCVGTLSTVSGWSDECGSCTERALWPVACSLYNSLHFQGQTTAL